MAAYRPIAADDREAYEAIVRQAFEPERGPRSEPASDDAWPPTLSEPRGVYAADDLVSVCVLYDLEATIRGEWTTIGGLGGVATPPEHRRRGYARRLLRGALREYRQDGVDLVVLWPSVVRFYRGLGWGTANWTVEAAVPPAQLGALDAPGAGRVRRLDVDDWERLRSVEVARGEHVGLSLQRSEAWWRERTLAGSSDDPAPFVYGYEREGDLRGYVLTRVREADAGRQLAVQDLAAVDRDAERALLRFLGDHDSQVETVRIDGPIARDLLELVPDPDALDVSTDTSEGPMVRLTDVARGLSSIAWPDGVDAAFVLALDDPLFDRNEGAFAVDVADGAGTVEPAGDADVDAHLDVGTLSRLAIGALDPERAIRLGAVDVRDEAARPGLVAAFRPEPVYLREFF